MAGTLICRTEDPSDRPRVLDLIEAVYGKRPADDLFPQDRLVVEEEGRVVAFAALYRLDDVVIGAVDWAAVEPGRVREDMVEILDAMLDGLRALKDLHGLRAVMVHTPYDEIRGLLEAPDIQVGEEKIRRLVVSQAPEP